MKEGSKTLFGYMIIFVIAYLIVIPSTLSIYKSGSQSLPTLELAEWNVSLNQTNVNDSLTIISGTHNDSYTLNVKSLSEVDVKYTIVISNLPSGVEVSLDSGTFQSQVNNTITFVDAGTILYSDSNRTKTHTLTFKANSGATVVNNRTVNIDVLVEQVL